MTAEEEPGKLRPDVERFLLEAQEKARLSSGDPDFLDEDDEYDSEGLMERIEIVAQGAKESLELLREAFTEENLLEKTPDGDNVLDRMANQDAFVRVSIMPLVAPLLARTGRTVEFNSNSGFGYAIATRGENGEEDKTEEPQPRMIVGYSYEWCGLDEKKEMQLAWDTANPYTRKAMRDFSNMNMGEIIDVFDNYVKEYIED